MNNGKFKNFNAVVDTNRKFRERKVAPKRETETMVVLFKLE